MEPRASRTPWWLGLVLVLVPLEALVLRRRVLLQHEGFLSDLMHAVIPLRVSTARALARGELPLWQPDHYSGLPLLALPDAGALYFPSWPLYLWLEPYTAFDVAVGLHALLGAAGAYALARAYGASPPAAVLGGLVFALAGNNIGHLKNPTFHATAAWIPWTAYFLERGLATGRARAWVAMAATLAMQILAGHLQATTYGLLFFGLRTLVAAWPQERPRMTDLARLVGPLAAVVLGVSLAAASLLPAWRYVGTTGRAGGLSWEQNTVLPYAPADLATLFAPLANGNYYVDTYSGSVQWENYLYLGLLPLGFALAGLRAGSPTTRFWQWTAVAAFLLALGPWTPLYGLAWSIIPGIAQFRWPARFLLVFTLAISVLSALGATRILARIPERRRGWFAAAILAIHTLDVGLGHRPFLPTGEPDAWWPADELVKVIDADGRRGRAITIDSFGVWHRTQREHHGFRGGSAPFERHAYVPLAASATLLGLSTPDGYAAMVPHHTAAWWAWIHTDWEDRMYRPTVYTDAEHDRLTPEYLQVLARANVAYVFADGVLHNPELAWLAEREGYNLYRLDRRSPRAFVATSWAVAADPDTMAAHVVSPDVRPVVLDGSASPGADASVAEVHVVDVSNHEIVLDVTGLAGLLVVTDSWGPDWRATVDGEPATVHLANGWQRGVLVPVGAREVRMRYWPSGATLGVVVSLLALLVAIGWLLLDRRRAQPR